MWIQTEKKVVPKMAAQETELKEATLWEEIKRDTSTKS